MAESEEELKRLLMMVKQESEKAGLKFNIQKTKIMASNPIISWQIGGETINFIFLNSKITADGDCSHEIKRCLLCVRKTMTNLDSMVKSRDITLPTMVRMFIQWSSMDVKVGPESLKTLESPLDCKIKPVNPKYSLERLMLKLKLQYFGHLM